MSGRDTPVRTWHWALAVVTGAAVLVALDLAENPESTTIDVALNLAEELPVILVVIGVLVLYRITRRYRE